MTDIVIASAARTPVGSFNGAFANLPAHDLGAVAIKAALERANLAGKEVDEVILGQVLTAGQGQNPARQAAMKAGIPEDKTAWSLNQVCGSGLRAVALGMLHVASGDADVIVAGGQELMSLSPHAAHMRGGTKMGDVKFIDTMIKDGLWDAFHGYHMGTTAENVAQKWQISREDQDKFAVASQNKAEAAQTSGRFKDEIAPVTVQSRKGDIVVDQDEYHTSRHDARRGCEAQARFLQGRHSHRRQCLGTERRRRRVRDHERHRGAAARHHAARPHRLLVHRRRQSGHHGLRPNSRLSAGAREGRLEGCRP